MQLVVYDTDKDRLAQCLKAIRRGASTFGVQPDVTPVDDALEMKRHGVVSRLPAISFGGMMWSLNNGKAFTVDQIEDLLARFI